MADGKRGRPSRWNAVELKRQYLEGVRDKQWINPKEYFKMILAPQGMRLARFRSLCGAGQWDEEARVERGNQALAEQTESLARARGNLASGMDECSRLQMEIMGKVSMELKAQKKHKPQDLKRLSETLAEVRQDLALSLEKPTSIVKGGTPMVLVQFQDEEAPYSARRVSGNTTASVDGPNTGTPSQVSGGERGAENTQDRPVLEVAPVESSDVPIQGGGVVSMSVQDTGEVSGVETDDGTPEPTADTADSGQDE